MSEPLELGATPVKLASPEASVVAVPSMEAIFTDHAAFVMRVVRRMGVHAADVEDVSQETFLVLQRKLDTYDPSRPLRPFVFGIAARVAIAHRRKAHVRREVFVESDASAVSEQGPDVLVERARTRARLDAALERLDDDKRRVFVAFDMEGISMAEIAEAEDCPLQTAYSRLYAARSIVRAAIADLRPEGREGP